MRARSGGLARLTNAILAGCAAVVVTGLLRSPPATSMPNDVRIPIVKKHPDGTPQAAALFRHDVHNQENCYACHPSVFPQYPLGFTHAEMNAGRFCGTCHDGYGGFDLKKAPCTRCHVPG